MGSPTHPEAHRPAPKPVETRGPHEHRGPQTHREPEAHRGAEAAQGHKHREQDRGPQRYTESQKPHRVTALREPKRHIETDKEPEQPQALERGGGPEAHKEQEDPQGQKHTDLGTSRPTSRATSASKKCRAKVGKRVHFLSQGERKHA